MATLAGTVQQTGKTITTDTHTMLTAIARATMATDTDTAMDTDTDTVMALALERDLIQQCKLHLQQLCSINHS
jgi:hypothetical protein